ncbi:MAG: hypothetical protein Q9166_001322 [cf. Caloplaca sp. 2 TL-2023]
MVTAEEAAVAAEEKATVPAVASLLVLMRLTLSRTTLEVMSPLVSNLVEAAMVAVEVAAEAGEHITVEVGGGEHEGPFHQIMYEAVGQHFDCQGEGRYHPNMTCEDDLFSAFMILVAQHGYRGPPDHRQVRQFLHQSGMMDREMVDELQDVLDYVLPETMWQDPVTGGMTGGRHGNRGGGGRRRGGGHPYGMGHGF